MKRLSDENIRFIEALIALVVAFVLMLIYYDVLLPRYGLEKTRVALIVMGIVALLLFIFAIFNLIMYFVIRFRRIRREREKPAEKKPDGHKELAVSEPKKDESMQHTQKKIPNPDDKK